MRKRKKKTKIADTVFEGNYLTISWPNFSQMGSGAADLKLKTSKRLNVNVDVYQRGIILQ